MMSSSEQSPAKAEAQRGSDGLRERKGQHTDEALLRDSAGDNGSKKADLDILQSQDRRRQAASPKGAYGKTANGTGLS